MTDLMAFLRARMDEDEAAAHRAGSDPWEFDGGYVDLHRDRLAPEYLGEFAEHIGRHDPSRVLREVEAKRRLLIQFELRGDSVRATVQPATGGVWDDLMRLLALPYADHADYRPEWTP